MKNTKGQNLELEGKNDRQSSKKPHLRLLMHLLKSRIQRALVFTVATSIATVLAQGLNMQILAFLILPPAITMISTLAVYLMNDIADVEIDKINSAHRPLASGLVKRSEAFVFVIILSISARVLLHR